MTEKPFGSNCCDARWGGFNTSHCAACHVTFSTVGNFDRHRRGGVCVDPAEFGMAVNKRGYMAMPGDDRDWVVA